MNVVVGLTAPEAAFAARGKVDVHLSQIQIIPKQAREFYNLPKNVFTWKRGHNAYRTGTLGDSFIFSKKMQLVIAHRPSPVARRPRQPTSHYRSLHPISPSSQTPHPHLGLGWLSSPVYVYQYGIKSTEALTTSVRHEVDRGTCGNRSVGRAG